MDFGWIEDAFLLEGFMRAKKHEKWLEGAAKAARKIGNYSRTCEFLDHLAFILVIRSNPQRAIDVSNEAIALAEEKGLPAWWKAKAMLNLARANIGMNQFESAIRLAKSAENELRLSGDEHGVEQARTTLSMAELCRTKDR